jgi:hypothetical protein
MVNLHIGITSDALKPGASETAALQNKTGTRFLLNKLEK